MRVAVRVCPKEMHISAFGMRCWRSDYTILPGGNIDTDMRNIVNPYSLLHHVHFSSSNGINIINKQNTHLFLAQNKNNRPHGILEDYL